MHSYLRKDKLLWKKVFTFIYVGCLFKKPPPILNLFLVKLKLTNFEISFRKGFYVLTTLFIVFKTTFKQEKLFQKNGLKTNVLKKKILINKWLVKKQQL